MPAHFEKVSYSRWSSYTTVSEPLWAAAFFLDNCGKACQRMRYVCKSVKQSAQTEKF